MTTDTSEKCPRCRKRTFTVSICLCCAKVMCDRCYDKTHPDD